ncbi:MAG: bifunctional phosphoglucose/phosphomannose isomerase [Candidatus Methanoplasma sp.]|jgi:glucose/mannose-6-phosphate isomerase|nr:bifunctional phosphoglucose/phosphomannose isomerase [Candidatus Methanoplasma sp.]
MADNSKHSFDTKHSSMAHEIYNFVDDLRIAVETPMKIDADFSRIMICGMGGSAIGGDIIKDCVIKESRYPITVQRFPELPKWVNSRTFVIISSYSGNTSETLSMYHQATEKKCTIVIMTSGGELERLGKERGDTIIKMKSGFQPRSALGLSLGYLAVIIDATCGTNCVQDIRMSLPALYRLRDKLSSDKSEAWKMAQSISGRIPVIYSTAGIYASATRWKSQINENSKMMAFAGSVPEFNHNEIAGWSEGELRSRCVLILLYEISAHKAIRKMADASVAALRRYGQDVKVIRIRGRTPLQRTLRAVMIGDYVSLYLAHLQGVDPMDIRSINEFKKRLDKMLYPVKHAGRSMRRKRPTDKHL